MTTTERISQHVLSLLQSIQRRPIFVGIQGPQGSGKSYKSKLSHNYLSSQPFNLRVAVLSIDDFYRSHVELRSMAASNPKNRLLNGRGQPGTHDVDLGVRILTALKDGKSDVELPRYDKSLHNGQGDRLPIDGSGVIIRQPPCLDVVILEGWCVGFHQIPRQELSKRWNREWAGESSILGIGDLASINDIEEINDKLHEYMKLWNFLDTLVQLVPKISISLENPSKYSIVYKWRLEQEHYMKAHNGGAGMNDDMVKPFVNRYIPGYVFFGNLGATWGGKGLKIVLNEEREMEDCFTF